MTAAKRIAALQALIDAGTATDAQRREYEAEKAVQEYARSKKPPKPVKEKRPKKPVKVRRRIPPGTDKRTYMADYRCEHRAELYAYNSRYYLEHREEIRKQQEERRRRLKGGERG